MGTEVGARVSGAGEVKPLAACGAGPGMPRRPAAVAMVGVLATVAFFVLDLVLPGATAAIGYCGVIVIVATGRGRRLLFGMAAFCTVLTWVGYVFEAPGPLEWISEFDRVMVTGVLWLTAILCWRWWQARAVLAEKAGELAARSHELAESNGALQRFASVISHDLRAPLSSIGLNTELLAMDLPCASAEQLEAIAAVRHGLEDMKGMIQNLLESSRAGHAKVAVDDCSCEEVLSEVLHRLKAPMQAAGARVRHEALPMVAADGQQLSRVFQNLIENAIKYRGEGVPEIEVSAVEGAEEWTLVVRDNGIGIAPEDAGKIFEMYQRGWADQRQYEGLGIGLSVCKEIIEGHGGRIWMESALGKGTSIIFTLPKRRVVAAKRREGVGAV